MPGKIGGKIRQLEGEAAHDLAVLRRHKILGGRRKNERCDRRNEGDRKRGRRRRPYLWKR